MLPLVDQIIPEIINLPLGAALGYLALKGIKDFSGKGYGKIKEIIVNKQNEGKYAFVPNKEEVLFLKEVERDPSYQQILMLVPNYKNIDLLRTGLLLKEYNRKIELSQDVQKNQTEIYRIKSGILKRPGGGRLLKIAKLPNSNFFPIILSYLYEMKIHGYPEIQLEEEFEELVEEWEKCSKFVDGEDTLLDIISFCKKQVGDKQPRFFILGLYEKQIKLIEQAIKRLDSVGLFSKEGYERKIEKDGTPDLQRIEVRFFKKLL